MAPHTLDTVFDTLRQEVDSACADAATQARAELLASLNQLFRRFRSYKTESDWIQTTVDAATPFAKEIAVFSLVNQNVQLLGQSPVDQWPAGLVFPLTSAAAFSSAVDLKDQVTALRTPGEVSTALSEGHSTQRAHLIPILNGTRVSAILFASDSGSDLNALELVATIASSVLERKANVAIHSQINSTAEISKPAAEAKLPAWGELPSDQRQLHIRAQRFARVAIAEIQLARPEACRAGREQGDLYLFLKREIDKARENYRKQFMTVPSMVDYLHLELIQTAAEGDEQRLGVDYPGRLQ